MSFILLDETLTVNTDYLVKVGWFLTDGELGAELFIAKPGEDKLQSLKFAGETAVKLWKHLHPKEDIPENLGGTDISWIGNA